MIDHEQPMLFAVDLEGCAAMAELPTEKIVATFVDALKAAGATVVQTMSHNFPGAGLTCVLVLAESHAILHTWPETATVNLDIFSCSTRLKSLAAVETIARAFGATAVTVKEIVRADGHVLAPSH